MLKYTFLCTLCDNWCSTSVFKIFTESKLTILPNRPNFDQDIQQEIYAFRTDKMISKGSLYFTFCFLFLCNSYGIFFVYSLFTVWLWDNLDKMVYTGVWKQNSIHIHRDNSGKENYYWSLRGKILKIFLYKKLPELISKQYLTPVRYYEMNPGRLMTSVTIFSNLRWVWTRHCLRDQSSK